MASNEALLPPAEVPFKEKCKQAGKKGAMYGGGAICVVFLILVIVQVIVYWVITAGCGPKVIGDDYAFPGGGKNAIGGSEVHLVPELSLLTERHPVAWGWPFDLMPANSAGAVSGAQVGTFWRNWGPLYWTYTYEDIQNSKLTMYMRQNFWVPWLSYKVARCDGKGDSYTFTEGSNWMGNKIRRWFGMNQAQSFKLYAGGEEVAMVQEVDTTYPSYTISQIKTGKEMASAILSTRSFHGKQDQWFISNKEKDEVPFFVTAALSLPTAFAEAEEKKNGGLTKEEKKERKKDEHDYNGQKPDDDDLIATKDKSAMPQPAKEEAIAAVAGASENKMSNLRVPAESTDKVILP